MILAFAIYFFDMHREKRKKSEKKGKWFTLIKWNMYNKGNNT